jgi:hypothetical protein
MISLSKLAGQEPGDTTKNILSHQRRRDIKATRESHDEDNRVFQTSQLGSQLRIQLRSKLKLEIVRERSWMSSRALDHDLTSNFGPNFKSQLHRTYLGQPFLVLAKYEYDRANDVSINSFFIKYSSFMANKVSNCTFHDSFVRNQNFSLNLNFVVEDFPKWHFGFKVELFAEVQLS